MPGSNAYEAVSRFTETLNLALSCVQPTKLIVSEGGQRVVGDVHAVTTVEPLSLRCADGTLTLSVSLNYVIVERSSERRDSRFKVSTRRYQHKIEDATTGAEIIAWHWHPGAGPADRPHIHIRSSSDGLIQRRGHVPSGRVTVEAVVWYALDDLRAQPGRTDWKPVLEQCESDFREFASWGSRRAAPTSSPGE